jgi:hypothetical protein
MNNYADLYNNNTTNHLIKPNGSWEMTNEEGFYSWDSNTGLLTFKGYVTDPDSPIVYLEYIIKGGNTKFVTTGGTRIGTRRIVAWDSGTRGQGILRTYQTIDNNDNSYVPGDEVLTTANKEASVFNWDLIVATPNFVGGIKSSSADYKVKVNPATGIATVAGIGDLAGLLDELQGAEI